MTAEKKQQFEDLIDAMMIEEVAGLDSELKAKLEGLPLDKKRMGILSILDQDRGLFMKILDVLNGADISKTDYIKHLVEMLRDYVKVGEVEKKTLGEVMTPISLVNDMLDTLPKEVWSNPNLKWLDPCGGCGIFASVIVERLMVGLDIYESDEERYRHIIENMLYVGELQPKNMFLHLVSFDPKDEFALNIYCGSFLDEGFDNHMKDVWGVDKFDVIVANPPYQSSEESNRKTQPIWHLFVEKALDILIEGGYMSMVHPSGWRNIDGIFKKTQKLLTSRQILYLEMHDTKDGLKVFKATTPYDYYCIKNTKNNGYITKIKGQNKIIDFLNLTDMEFIPNGMFTEIFSLVAKEGEEKVEILHSFSAYETRKPYISKTQDEEFKYPCVRYIFKGGDMDFLYSNIKKGHFEVPKVIFGTGAGVGEITVDINGDFGLCQFNCGIVDNVENLNRIKISLNSKKFKDIMKFCQFNRQEYSYKVIKTFRKDFWKEFID